jgi:ketosteroid isomerase-like protein
MAMSDAEADAVIAANADFYRAFSERDLETMDALWAHESPVVCIHPGWNPLHTRDAVMKSWADILGNAGAPAISTDNATAVVQGNMAFVVCDELLQRAVLAATNVFVREDGAWKICHHHAAPVAQPAQARDRSPEFLN